MEVHHKHGPLGNWREFAKEIGIVVIGVLIALGGEQVVEAIHHRSEVQEVRKSLKEEMAFNMATLKEAVDQIPCETRRLDDLERWANALQSAHPLHLARVADVPFINIFRDSTWRSSPADTLARFPLAERNSFAFWYDGVNTESGTRQQILQNWLEIRKLSRASRLSDDQRIELLDDIDNLRSLYAALQSANDYYWPPLAKTLGVSPSGLRLANDFRAARAAMCRPLLAS